VSAPQVTQASVVSATLKTIRVDFDQAMVQSTLFYDTSSWSVAGHTVASVSSKLGESSALLELVDEMRNGSSITVTVSDFLTCVATNDPMDQFHLSATFTGEGFAPVCLTGSAVDSRTIRLQFDENLSSTSSVTVSRGSSQVAVNSSEVYANTMVVIHLGAEMLDGASHTVRWLAVNDRAGNTSTGSISVIGLGTLPEVSSVALKDRKLSIAFSEDMKIDAALRSRFSYAIRALDSGSAAVHVERVASTAAREVVLDLTEMTDGAYYELMVVGPTDLAGNSMNPWGNFGSFFGVGSTPTLREVRAVGPNLIDAIFSVNMQDNAALREVSRWSFDGGIVVLKVVPDTIDRRVVHLAVNGWTPGVEYTLTIDPS